MIVDLLIAVAALVVAPIGAGAALGCVIAWALELRDLRRDAAVTSR